jgi:hypothetical protein
MLASKPSPKLLSSSSLMAARSLVLLVGSRLLTYRVGH